MMLKVTDEAERDLIVIADYIARDNPKKAIEFVDQIRRRCQAILDQPRSCPVVGRHESTGVRRAVFGNYSIFYRFTDQDVVILHVLNSAVDSSSWLCAP